MRNRRAGQEADNVPRAVRADADVHRRDPKMTKLRVLVVEDEWLNADLIGMLAEDCGCIVEGVAQDIETASIIAARGHLDLALVDIQLGADDGIAFAQTLRDRHGTRIVFMTGAGDAETHDRITRFKPFGAMFKPFNVQQLQDMLDRAAAAASLDSAAPRG